MALAWQQLIRPVRTLGWWLLIRPVRALGWWLGDLLAEVGAPVPGPLQAPLRPLRSELAEVQHLLARPGCLACSQAAQAVERCFVWFLLESYGEGPWIERLKASAGFCPSHFWALAASEARYQLSYVAQYLAEADRTALRAVAARVSAGGRRAGAALAALAPTRPCPACETEEYAVHYAIGRLLRALADPAVRERWERSDGLCWPHARLAVAQADEATLRALLPVQIARLSEAIDPDPAAARRADPVAYLIGWG